MVPSLSPTSSTTPQPPSPGCESRPLALSRESRAVSVSEKAAANISKPTWPLAAGLGSDAAILKRRKQPAPDADLLRPRGTERTASHLPWRWLGRACMHLKLRERQWRDFCSKPRGKRISIPERTTAKTKLYPAAAAGFCLAAPSPNNK